MISRKPVHYLLVEDDVDHAELISLLLKKAGNGNHVTRVEHGEAALQYLGLELQKSDSESALPDLILLDINMPRLNGFDTLRALKSDRKLKCIPVVVVSTSATEREIYKCYDLGATGYISKPSLFDDLRKKIEILDAFWSQVSEIPIPEAAGEYVRND